MTTINTWPGWRVVRQIGAGSFGRVYEIETTESGAVKKAAMKVMSIPSSPDELQDIYDSGIAVTEEDATTYIRSQIENVSQEFKVMAALKGNPNIVSFEDHMVIPHEGWIGSDILIRMELLTPLNKYLRTHRLTEEDVIRLGIDMCGALETCHAYHPPILHRDIKAANIMVDGSGNFKLGDFGVARVMEGTRSAHTKAGTEDYMAPEVLQMKGYRATADLYSLGIVLYRMLNNNRNPFLPVEGSLTENLQLQAKTKRLSGDPVPAPQSGSASLHAVILKALAYEPADRFQTAGEMRLALEQCCMPYEDPISVEDDKTFLPGMNAGIHNNQNKGKDKKKEKKKADRKEKKTESRNREKAAGGKSKSKMPIIAAAALILVAFIALLSANKSGTSTSRTGLSGTTAGQTESSGKSSLGGDFDSIEILTDSLMILEGDTMRLRLKAGSTYLQGDSGGISWSSSNTEVARFSSNGDLQAISPGTFTITAEYEGYTTTGDMTVVAQNTESGVNIEAEPDSLSIKQGEEETVKVRFGGDLPEKYSALVYDSAGLLVNLSWGTIKDHETTLTVSDLYSSVGTDGTLTFLVYDKDDTSKIYGSLRVPVHIKE